MRKSLFILFVSLYITSTLQAQFVDYGSDPSRYKWNYVDLPHYKLIFPAGTDSMAYHYALYLENIFPQVQKSISMPRKKIFPVVLHPGSMHSNGLVAWAPRRMELITNPSTRIDAQNWDKHLVLHESRHVIQTSKLMTGFVNPLYYLIGEQAAGISSFFSTKWFFEGDAVGVETAMSNSGRGRLPEFNMIYRAQLLSDKFFSFDKWYLGSYKDYTGDYYALGYDLTSFAKYKYGSDIWDKITTRYISHFLHLPPFPKAIKHHTGDNVDGLFNQTFEFLRKEWETLDAGHIVPDYVSQTPRQYTSYRYPQAIDDTTVVAVKSSLYDINSLVMFVNGKEKHLAWLGSINSRLNLQDNRIYWTENVSGLRWTHENYSEIKQYDLATGKVTALTARQRYLSPALQPNGRLIAASRPTFNGENQIVLIDRESGTEETVFSLPQNAFAKELTFTDPHHLVALTVDNRGLSLQQLHIETGEWQELLPPTSVNITSPVGHNGRLYFESGLNGTNNIYTMDMQGKISKVTSARFGAFHPAFSANRLFFSDYQAKGYRIASLPLREIKAEAADIHTPYRFPLAEAIASQEGFNIDTAQLKPVRFEPKRYRKGSHLFNVHSWAPFYYDVSEIMNASASDFTSVVKPGITLISQNALNTATTQAGWYYDNGNHHGRFAFTYTGWFPVFDLKMDYGGKSVSMAWTPNDEGKDVPQLRLGNRKLLETEMRMYLPFNLTKDHYTHGFQPSVTYYLTNNRYQQYDSREYRNFQYLLSELRYYRYRRMATRDILPRWGYQIRLQYLNSPFNSENYGSLYAARLTTYWPGLMQNHSLMLRFGYQYQSVDDKVLFLPKRIMDKPRGYDYIYQTRQHLALKADYAFTVACPDWSLGSLVYLRRIRTNLFYDWTRNQAKKDAGWITQSSAGLDLLFDWNVIRMSYPLSAGVRLTQPIDYGKFQAEFLFSMSF
ncbi:hypothetical protein [Parabacteroides sp. PF5-6]|uniref:hypothetical protein n=1 Tax=Parabacteroides sp. PF5-6 TaxID=1742403 RepID=UPI00240537A6|nr:hypothetical protein [Parabacteroides sp. PF5-6]MDF9829766.1 hypothetical protein [Parabacteroides sp. PF5-6]